MRMTFSTFVTPTRDSDTWIVGADACTSGTPGTGVGSIDSGGYRGLRERNVGAEPRAAAVRAPDPQPAPERFDAVRQAAQAGSALAGRPADAVVAHLDNQPAVLRRDLDARRRRPRVLRDVRQAFGDEVVDRHLDCLRGAPVELDLQLHRNRGSRDEGVERDAEAAVGDDRGMDPAGELAELTQRLIELEPGLLEPLDRAGVLGELPLQRDQLQCECDQALLGPVVEVALEAAPLALGGLDDAG